jgi:hypothetical protein
MDVIAGGALLAFADSARDGGVQNTAAKAKAQRIKAFVGMVEATTSLSPKYIPRRRIASRSSLKMARHV